MEHSKRCAAVMDEHTVTLDKKHFNSKGKIICTVLFSHQILLQIKKKWLKLFNEIDDLSRLKR